MRLCTISFTLLPAIVYGLDWFDMLMRVNEGDEEVACMVLDKWKDRPEGFAAGLTVTGVETLGGKINMKDITELDLFFLNFGTLRLAQKRWSDGISITDVEFKEMEIDVCVAIVKHHNLVRNLTGVPEGCREALYTHVKNAPDQFPKFAKRVPPEWILKDGGKVIQAINATGARKAAELTIETAKTLFHQCPDVCKELDARFLWDLGVNKGKLMTPECFARISGIGNIFLFTGSLPDNVFALYNGPLYHSALERITGPQIAHFASEFELPDGAYRCQELHLGYADPKALSMIHPACLEGSFRIERRWIHDWRAIPDATIKAVDWCAIVGNIDGARWAPKSVLRKLADCPTLFNQAEV